MGNFVDAWYPATSDFGLIEAPVASVVATFVRWQAGIGKAPVESRQPSLESTFAALAPLSAELRRAAFVPTKSGCDGVLRERTSLVRPFPGDVLPCPTISVSCHAGVLNQRAGAVAGDDLGGIRVRVPRRHTTVGIFALGLMRHLSKKFSEASLGLDPRKTPLRACRPNKPFEADGRASSVTWPPHVSLLPDNSSAFPDAAASERRYVRPQEVIDETHWPGQVATLYRSTNMSTVRIALANIRVPATP